MRFPVRVRHRKAEVTIFGRSKSFPYYRVCYRVGGKRAMRTFRTYAEAHQEAETTVREIARGDQSLAMSPKETADALGALAALREFSAQTGRRFTMAGVVSEFTSALRLLGDRPLGEAVRGYLASVATVTREDLGEAVREFLASRAVLTKATNGDRPQLGGKYAYNLEIQLTRFAAMFPATAVCDLAKDHLDAFIGGLADMSPKTRNHYRATLRLFLEWATRKDYLARTHRLAEADGLRPERANTAEVQFYTPAEFHALLGHTEGPLLVMVAVGGLCGLRTQELLRLDWADLRRVPGHIEVTARKAKTRQRRLVPIPPVLASWLEPFSAIASGPIWTQHEITFQRDLGNLCRTAGVARKPNGLRHAFCTYAFALHGEIVAAQQAGNSPSQLHAHYKGLATKAEAEKWFTVAPASPRNVIPLAAKA